MKIVFINLMLKMLQTELNMVVQFDMADYSVKIDIDVDSRGIINGFVVYFVKGTSQYVGGVGIGVDGKTFYQAEFSNDDWVGSANPFAENTVECVFNTLVGYVKAGKYGADYRFII